MGTHKKSSGWSSSPSYEYSPFLDTPTCENGSIQKPSLTKNHSDSLSTWVLSRLSATWRMRYATFLASGTGRFLKKQSEKLELEYYWSSSTARSAETFCGWERDPQSENGTGKIDEIWCNRNPKAHTMLWVSFLMGVQWSALKLFALRCCFKHKVQLPSRIYQYAWSDTLPDSARWCPIVS